MGLATLMHKIAYLPIEFAARELDSKTLLAVELCRRGWVVVIGQQWKIYKLLEKLPIGIILFKGYHKTYWPAFAAAKRRGHFVSVIEEELFNTDSEEGVSPLISPGLGKLVDLVFAQSESELHLLKNIGGVLTTRRSGNPRADLLKPFFLNYWDQDIQSIRNSFGRYILVNTNFGLTNSGWGSYEAAKRAAIQSGVLRENDANSISFFNSILGYENYCKQVILESIEQISKSFNSAIIVRPHPGEGLDFWQHEAGKYKNVFIRREGSHVPWTLGSDLLLHGGCTTGFEAWIAKKPSITIWEPSSVYAKSLLANRVSIKCASSSDVISAISDLYQDRSQPLEPCNSISMFGLSEASRNYLKICDSFDSFAPNSERLDDVWGEIKRIVSNELSQEVVQLTQKCSIDTGILKQSINRISMQLSAGRVLGEKIGESLYIMRAARKDVYYHGKPCHIEPDSRESSRAFAALVGSNSKEAVEDYMSMNRDTLRRNPNFFLSFADFWCNRGEPELVEEQLRQAVVIGEQIDDVMVRAFEIAKIANLDCCVRAFAFRNSIKLRPPQYLKSLKILSPLATRILVVGDSHCRAFRVARFLRLPDDFLQRHVDVLEIGGATAYGLGNDDSKSGARSKILSLLPVFGEYDICIWHFGEIDCRRAGWRASVKFEVPVEEIIRASVVAYSQFVGRIAASTPNTRHVVVCPKWPLVSSEVMVKISKIDERSLGVSSSERFRITQLFEKTAVELFGKLGLQVLRFSDSKYLLNIELNEYNEIALRGCLEDDVHGSMKFFGDVASAQLEFIGKNLLEGT